MALDSLSKHPPPKNSLRGKMKFRCLFSKAWSESKDEVKGESVKSLLRPHRDLRQCLVDPFS